MPFRPPLTAAVLMVRLVPLATFAALIPSRVVPVTVPVVVMLVTPLPALLARIPKRPPVIVPLVVMFKLPLVRLKALMPLLAPEIVDPKVSVNESPPVPVRLSALPAAVVIPKPDVVVTTSGVPLVVCVTSAPAAPEQTQMPDKGAVSTHVPAYALLPYTSNIAEAMAVLKNWVPLMAWRIFFMGVNTLYG